MNNYRIVVLAVVLFSYTICFACRISIGVLLPSIQAEFSLTNSQAGALMSVFFLGYVMTQIPAGVWFGKFGTRYLTAAMIFLSSVFTFLIGTSMSLLSIQAYRFCLGLVQGPISIGSFSIVNKWFPPWEKGTATGVYLLSNMLASIAVPPIITLIIMHFGWRYSLYFFAIPSVVASMLWYFLLRDRPEASPLCSEKECAYIRGEKTVRQHLGCVGEQKLGKKSHILTTRSGVFYSWNICANTLAYFFISGVLYGLLTWIPSYLISNRHYSLASMGWMATAPWIGGCLGSIVGGWISDKIFYGRRKPTMIMAALATTIMMAILINIPDNSELLLVALGLTGFFLYLGMPGFTSYSMSITSLETYPLAVSIVNSGGSLGGLFSPVIAGIILDINGSYMAVFSFFGSCALLAFVMILTMKEEKY